MTHRIYNMTFASVYRALVAKAERKGRTAQDVHEVTSWLTGYSTEAIATLFESDLTYGDFFRQAPNYNPNRINITGKICGVQIETLEDPLMQEIRRLDKLVDWVAKGKTFKQIKDKYE
ncbi:MULTISPECIES: DUF2200 domain-containing protein [Streptococcus]|uniref:DUF2200 domain-containing protein n=1 Tax=Streptococcus caledonicus TaxID=2614158 RepID=A0ABW0UDU1_9STRE|nr:DUF2200 domain-containing protein [Streptococcus sp. S784/96/1]